MRTPTPDDEEADPGLEAFWATADGVALADELGAQSAWLDPPPELEQRIVGAIEAAADAETRADGVAAPQGVTAGTVVDLAARRDRFRRIGVIAPWIAAAAATIVAVTLAVGAGGGGRQVEFTAALAGTDLAPAARAEAELRNEPSGLEIRLDVTGLPRAPAGFYYQAWLKGDRGLVAIGTFHTGGNVVLWSGVDVKGYPAITVTLEPDDGVQTSSGKRVLAGDIRAR